MTTPYTERLQTALLHHKAGERAAAERLYRAVLDEAPDHPEATHLLGVLQLQSGRTTESIAWFQRAIALRPGFAEAHLNLGTALLESGQIVDAIAAFREALRWNRRLPAAHNNLGMALRLDGQFEVAVDACRRALAIQPQYPNAYNNLGLALSAAGRAADAVQAYRDALRQQPQHIEALRNLAAELIHFPEQLDEAVALLQRALAIAPKDLRALTLLGIVQRKRGALDEAEAALRIAADSPAADAAVFAEWAGVLQDLERRQDAIVAFRRALELRPDYPDVLVNLALLLAVDLQSEEAESLCRRALQLQPEMSAAWNALAPLLHESGRFDEGFAASRRAVECAPDSVVARFNRSMFLLTVGNLAEGWVEYDYRLQKDNWRPIRQRLTRPRWDGSPLDGRRILLITEQGLGDAFQFVRYARLLHDHGARVAIAAPKPLLGILATCPGVEELAELNNPWPEHDVYLEMMSGGRYLARSLDDVPAPIPYLSARPDLIEQWRNRLAQFAGFRIAIAWQGSHSDHDYRRVPLEHFEALGRLPHVHLISVQIDGASQLRALQDRLPVVDFSDELDRRHGAFQDTAAILMNVDLVISSDTSIPHLAGALGCQVWLALRYTPEWRWLLDRDDTPWYPRMRLFRQRRPGDWSEVFDRMAKELAYLPASRSDAGK